jgi:hypothetical protein
MDLYIVVHHKVDPERPWPNEWLDDDRLSVITTTTEIGTLCNEARRRQERVFVHRCAWGSFAPTICCSVEVERVDVIDRRTSLVTFVDAAVVGRPPPQMPGRGTNYYFEDR